MSRFVSDMTLLSDFVRAYPAQPATAVWRTIEIDALLRVGLPPGRGLDLGCGDGKLTEIILRRTGPRALIGIDPDPLEIAAASRTGIYEALHAAPGDALPIDASSIDFVISNSVLEHIPALEPVLDEVGRVLKPGGIFLFTVPGPGFHANLAGSVLPWVARARYLKELDQRLAHLRYPTADEWRGLCHQAGLRMEQALGYLSRSQTRVWENLSRVTGGLLYALSGKRHHPIVIQRTLGLRQLQNRRLLPQGVGTAASRVISAYLQPTDTPWLSEERASCLLIQGRRA